MDTRHVHLAGEFKWLREQVIAFQATIEDTKFSGEDPLFVSNYITSFVKEANFLVESKTRAFLIIQKLCKG